jgi:hypothetical protein
MDPDARLALFRRYNPFTSSSVGDPWEATYPDVPSINEHAFRGLWQLIEQKTQSPALNCAGLRVFCSMSCQRPRNACSLIEGTSG